MSSTSGSGDTGYRSFLSSVQTIAALLPEEPELITANKVVTDQAGAQELADAARTLRGLSQDEKLEFAYVLRNMQELDESKKSPLEVLDILQKWQSVPLELREGALAYMEAMTSLATDHEQSIAAQMPKAEKMAKVYSTVITGLSNMRGSASLSDSVIAARLNKAATDIKAMDPESAQSLYKLALLERNPPVFFLEAAEKARGGAMSRQQQRNNLPPQTGLSA